MASRRLHFAPSEHIVSRGNRRAALPSLCGGAARLNGGSVSRTRIRRERSNMPVL